MTEREKLEGLLDKLERASALADTFADYKDAQKKTRKAILALFDAQSPHPWVRIEPGCAMPEPEEGELFALLQVAHSVPMPRGEVHRYVKEAYHWCSECPDEWGGSATHWRYHTPVPHPDDVAAKGGE